MFMSNFNIARFGKLAKWSLVGNWRKWVRAYLIYTLCLFLIYAFYTVAFHNDLHSVDAVNIARSYSALMGVLAVMTNLMVAVVLLSAMPARILAHLRGKQARVGYLMVPATGFEKYLLAFLEATVGGLLLVGCSILTADLLRFALSLMVWPGFNGFVFMHSLDLITGPVSSAISSPMSFYLIWQTMALSMVCCHATYTLGGVLFRKNSWLFTTIAIVTLMFLGLFVGLDFSFVGRLMFSENSFQAFLVAVSALLAVLSAVEYWLGYRLFRRIQVISNKWTNI